MAALADRRDDRAQLILISAVGLAILLVVLALALNTAAYGEVHVSQADDGLYEQRAAAGYQDAVRRGVAGAMAGYNLTEADLRATVADWDDLATAEYARDGAATNASLSTATVENRIVQDDVRNFTAANGSTDWTLAGNASAVENYSMAVEAAELAAVDDCTNESGCFTLTVADDDGDAWRLFLHDASGNETVDLLVETANGSEYTCTAGNSSASINVSDGVFVDESGNECGFPSYRDDGQLSSPYSVTYDNAASVSGTYNLTVTGTVVDGSVETDDRYTAAGSPRITPRVASATVSISYRSPNLVYRTEIRVRPGDADD